MDSITLTKKEIAGIQQFIEETKKLEIVVCVYVGAYFNNTTNNETIHVMVLNNNGIYWRRRNIEDWDLNKDNKNLDAIVNIFNTRFRRLIFVKHNWDNYDPKLMSARAIESAKDIMSSEIVFDREKSISHKMTATEFKEIVSSKITPYENAIPIENINQINTITEIKRKK